jgi:phenylalanyl-tRNA synthetase beta chain
MAADQIAIAKDLGFQGQPNVIELGQKGQNAYALEMPACDLPGPGEQVIPPFRPFSRFPAVTRDLSLLVPLGLGYAALEAALSAALQTAPLQDARCVDIYKDRKLTAAGQQAWLMRFKFQSPNKTLTSEEADAWMAAALEAAQQLGCGVR